MVAYALALFLLRQDLTLDTVLAQTRQAVGFEALNKLRTGVVLSGDSIYYGESGGYKLMFDPNGEFLETISGAVKDVNGFDGTTAWEIDPTGATRKLIMEEQDGEEAGTWFTTHKWLDPASPFKLSIIPGETDGKTVTLNLVSASRLYEARIKIDRSTWLPSTYVHESPEGRLTIEIQKYMDFKGVKLPGHVESTQQNITNIYDIKKVEDAPIFVRSPYQYLPVTPADTHFNNSVPAALEMKRAPTGHILVHPRVNGQDVGWFILDSGAGSMVIDKGIADKLNLRQFGKLPAIGVGGAVESHFREGSSIKLGRATIDKPQFLELDLSMISSVFGVPLAGIVGYDLFRRTIVEVNLEKNHVAVLDPSSYVLPAGGTWQPLLVFYRHPIIKATYEGDRSGLFRLDTGAQGTVTFHSPTVTSFDLMKGKEVHDVNIGGVGANAPKLKEGELAYFEISGHRFIKPTVLFASGSTGPLADRTLAGNIGQDFMVPFNLVFDYLHDRIAFVKNK